MLVSDGLRVANYAGGRLGSVRPEMKDDPIRLSGHGGDFLRVRLRHIENLDTTCGNLDVMVMIILVPGFHRHMRARDRFGDEVFDIREPRVGISRFKQQTLQNFR